MQLSLNFSTLGLADERRAHRFLEQFAHKENLWNQIEAFRLCEALSKGLDQDNDVFATDTNGILNGLLWVQRREWDSTHFGTAVTHINTLLADGDYISSRSTKELLINQWLRRPFTESVNYLVVRLGANDLSGLHALEASKFHILAPMTTLLWKPKAQPGQMERQLGYQFTPYRPGDLEELKSIAAKCFTHSRFHQEDGWPRTKSDQLHVKWIENCCLAGLADIVIVARAGNQPLGFIACKIDEFPIGLRGIMMGSIVLLGVSPTTQGRGIGTQLVQEAVHWLRDAVDAIEVRTEAYNYASIRSYQKAGFQIVDHSIYYRQWLKAATESVSRYE